MRETYIITGTQGSGKTILIRKVVSALKEKGVNVGGILAEGSWKNEMRDSFRLYDLKTINHIIFCQRDPMPGWEKILSFYVNPLGQQFGEQALAINHLKDTGLVVIDEIGPFELQGKGWAASFERILDSSEIPLLISVRESLVDQVVGQWKLNVKQIFVAGKATTNEIEAVLHDQVFNI